MSTNRHGTKIYGSHQVGHRVVTCIKYKITKYTEILPYLLPNFLSYLIPTIGLASCKIRSDLKYMVLSRLQNKKFQFTLPCTHAPCHVTMQHPPSVSALNHVTCFRQWYVPDDVIACAFPFTAVRNGHAHTTTVAPEKEGRHVEQSPPKTHDQAN